MCSAAVYKQTSPITSHHCLPLCTHLIVALGQVSIVELKSSQSWVWLQWTTPPPSPYPVVADHYAVTCRDGVRLYCQVMVSGQVQSVTITGLVPGTAYEFQVGYTSGGFPGRLSEPSKVSTLQGELCVKCLEWRVDVCSGVD